MSARTIIEAGEPNHFKVFKVGDRISTADWLTAKGVRQVNGVVRRVMTSDTEPAQRIKADWDGEYHEVNNCWFSANGFKLDVELSDIATELKNKLSEATIHFNMGDKVQSRYQQATGVVVGVRAMRYNVTYDKKVSQVKVAWDGTRLKDWYDADGFDLDTDAEDMAKELKHKLSEATTHFKVGDKVKCDRYHHWKVTTGVVVDVRYHAASRGNLSDQGIRIHWDGTQSFGWYDAYGFEIDADAEDMAKELKHKLSETLKVGDRVSHITAAGKPRTGVVSHVWPDPHGEASGVTIRVSGGMIRVAHDKHTYDNDHWWPPGEWELDQEYLELDKELKHKLSEAKVPFKVGDWVKLTDGNVTGVVAEVGISSEATGIPKHQRITKHQRIKIEFADGGAYGSQYVWYNALYFSHDNDRDDMAKELKHKLSEAAFKVGDWVRLNTVKGPWPHLTGIVTAVAPSLDINKPQKVKVKFDTEPTMANLMGYETGELTPAFSNNPWYTASYFVHDADRQEMDKELKHKLGEAVGDQVDVKGVAATIVDEETDRVKVKFNDGWVSWVPNSAINPSEEDKMKADIEQAGNLPSPNTRDIATNLPIAVMTVAATVEQHLGDVITDDMTDEEAAEECWTLALDAAIDFVGNNGQARAIARQVCQHLGYR